MLNITNRISLSKKGKKKISKFWKKNEGNLDAESWNKISKSVKNELSEKLLKNQGFKCAYCERYLYAQTPEMDHFAHKAKFPRFSFNPTNLFYSCGYCNSASIKGQKNTVAVFNNRYDLTTFNIVHPIRNIPDDHIKYSDVDRIDLDVAQCTFKGKRTIIFFKYHKSTMTLIRSRDLIKDRLNPLTNDQEIELIQEAIAYR